MHNKTFDYLFPKRTAPDGITNREWYSCLPGIFGLIIRQIQTPNPSFLLVDIQLYLWKHLLIGSFIFKG